MARYKTKKQKKKQSIKLETSPLKVEDKIVAKKIQTTIFSETQVKLLYKDLAKTFFVTLVVSLVLLSIFLYVR